MSSGPRPFARAQLLALLLLALAPPAAPHFCGLVMNDSSRVWAFAAVDNVTGVVRDLQQLPLLDEFGLGVSAGASSRGVYYTVSGNVSEQEDMFVVDLARARSQFVPLRLPPQFSFLALFGVAMLDVDARTQRPLAMVMGYAPDNERYCFLGIVDDATGAVDEVVYNLTDAYRTWVYLYSGVSAWDAARGVYYLEAVTGAKDTTALFAFNTSDQRAGASAQPLAYVPFDGVGMLVALAVSPALAAAHGGPGLVALVDDDSNTAGALWLLTTPGGDWAKAAWVSLYQYAPDTLSGGGNDNFELSDDGLTAFSVFYDEHRPVANQVVSAVDLRAAPAREVARTIVQGSEDGTASIADLARCPPGA